MPDLVSFESSVGSDTQRKGSIKSVCFSLEAGRVGSYGAFVHV